MEPRCPGAHTYVPDGVGLGEALGRATYVGIGAHPDDLEFMAWWPIAQCHDRPDRWFVGVIATDGAGSPRSNAYAFLGGNEMRRIRLLEQLEVARRGRYSAMVCLGYASGEARTTLRADLLADITDILMAGHPEAVFTHNLADKHETHVAVALATVEACRRLPPEHRPKRLYGCEAWRGLDWLPDEEKVLLDVSGGMTLMEPLMQVYESQIGAGKRYDLAAMGRKRANATWLESHACDKAEALEYVMDMTPLMEDPTLDVQEFMSRRLRGFEEDVMQRLARLAREASD